MARPSDLNNSEGKFSEQERLINACKTGDLQTVAWLMETNSLEASDVLIVAAEAGNEDIVSELLKGHFKSRRLHNALIRACRNGHCCVIKLLTADERCNPAHDHNAAVFVACSNGHVEAVQALLNCDKVIMAIKDNSLFAVACQQGNFEMVCVLGPFVKFNVATQLPQNQSFSKTQCRASSCQTLGASVDTPSSVLMKFCVCAMQKENLPLIRYLFSSSSPIIDHTTLADRLSVIDKLLVLSTGSKSTMTVFSTSLISELVALVLEDSSAVDEKILCCVGHKLPRIRALLRAYMIYRYLAMIGQMEGYLLPTEISQLIAFFALLS